MRREMITPKPNQEVVSVAGMDETEIKERVQGLELGFNGYVDFGRITTWEDLLCVCEWLREEVPSYSCALATKPPDWKPSTYIRLRIKKEPTIFVV